LAHTHARHSPHSAHEDHEPAFLARSTAIAALSAAAITAPAFAQNASPVVEDGDTGFTRPNRSPAQWSHNISMRYEVTDDFTLRAGVTNLTNERPYAAEAAYPVSARGRSYFLGATANF
jgi:outer membrane receptor protein involved in Fe transport